MGNVPPSGMQVLRQPSIMPERYDYIFDLSGCSDSQINTHFIKIARKHRYLYHLGENKKLCVKEMSSDEFELYFRKFKPNVVIVRAPSVRTSPFDTNSLLTPEI